MPDIIRKPKAQPTAAAWAFVLDHAEMLEKYALSLRFRDEWMDPEDFLHDLICNTVNGYRHFDASKGTAKTWLGWRARLTCVQRRRKRDRIVREKELADIPYVHGASGVQQPLELMEQAVMVQQILAKATPAEKAACLTLLNGVPSRDVHAVLGVTTQARDHRIKKLGQRIRESL